MHVVHTLSLGVMDNFIYIIADHVSGKAMVVDPAWDADKILQTLSANQWELSGILLTHTHADHISAVNEILSRHDVPVYLNKVEFQLGFIRLPISPSFVGDGDVLALGETSIAVIETPGHTIGSVCYLINHQDLIAGDTLFIDGCGRCNFKESDVTKMYDSLQRLRELPDEVCVYPGHDYGQLSCDSLGNQKKTNPYLLIKDKAFFISFRMALQSRYRQIPFSPSSLSEIQSIYDENF